MLVIRCHRLLRHMVMCILCLTSLPAMADVVVIINAKNTLDNLSKLQIRNIYMGRMQYLPTGGKITSINTQVGVPSRTTFFGQLLKKKDYHYHAYWSRKLFSEGKYPPKTVASDQQALDLVASSINTIAYIDESMVDERIKVILVLPTP